MIVPQNDLYIPVGEKSSTTTEHEFEQIIDTVASLYSESGIQVYKFWEDGTVNAYAENVMGIKSVNFFGGFARLPKMTSDAFAMVVCHEYGHHLGGTPSKTSPYSSWAAAEGQSDYFAATKCLKRYFAIVPEETETETIEQCLVASDPQMCSRIAKTAEVLTGIFHMVEGDPTELPSINTPSLKVVEKTNRDEYPSNQCRLDTYLAGAICNVDPTTEGHFFKPEIGYCHPKNGDTIGFRPSCWFANN